MRNTIEAEMPEGMSRFVTHIVSSIGIVFYLVLLGWALWTFGFRGSLLATAALTLTSLGFCYAKQFRAPRTRKRQKAEIRLHLDRG